MNLEAGPQRVRHPGKFRLGLRTFGEVASENLNGAGIWLLAIVGTLGLPCLPLAIEALRDGRVKHETYFLEFVRTL